MHIGTLIEYGTPQRVFVRSAVFLFLFGKNVHKAKLNAAERKSP